MPVSSRFWRNTPSIRPTVGKFCTPSKPIAFSSRRNTGIIRNGSVPQTPASTGVSLHDRQHLARHVDDDGVGVAVGHQPGEAAAAGHAEAARVVDDDQVDAAALGELGRDAGPGAGADDRRRASALACADGAAQSSRAMNGMSARPGSGAACQRSSSQRVGERGIVDVRVDLDERERSAQRASRSDAKSARVRLRIVKRLARRVDRADAAQRQHEHHRPGRAIQLRRRCAGRSRALVRRRAHQRHASDCAGRGGARGSCAGTVSMRAEVHHVERADRHDLRDALPRPPPTADRARRSARRRPPRRTTRSWSRRRTPAK